MTTLTVKTQKKHEISPYLYMQFIEPLGCADSSVDAAWNFIENDWHTKVIDKVRELSPTMIRFGGAFASYYHWKEGIGPISERVPMINHCWSGIYHNRVGTHEVVDFCRKVNAELLMVANMESEGLTFWQRPKNDGVRMGTAEEAAEWVDYCNNPENPLRIKNGAKDPFNVKYWQVGNETSYDVYGKKGFDLDGTYECTVRFAEAMKKKDSSIKIIGWGDETNEGVNWCRKMDTADGVDLLAFHYHMRPAPEDTHVLGTNYRKDFEKTWDYLMNAPKSLDEKIKSLRADCKNKRLAMTEGHFVIPGRNRNEVLSTWAAGVAYAKCHNILMRHSDILDIATLADFMGNVWQVNALIIPTPMDEGDPYLQPVGSVMSLFGHHQGKYMLDCSSNGALDVTASMTESKIFIHLANTDMTHSQEVKIDIGAPFDKMDVFSIHENPETEITPMNIHVFDPTHTTVQGDTVTLPPATVAAIEIKI